MELVSIKGKEAVCSSLDVAERFGKRHDNIIRSIGNLLKIEDVKPLFKASKYIDEKGEDRPMYYMTRDGFSLLVMGFTGAEAMKWKLDYIKAFNAMEKVIQEQQSNEWKFFRQQGKAVRLAETDTLKQLAEYSKAMGSNHPGRVYSNYTKLANKTVGIKNVKEATVMQLNLLMVVENMLIQIIQSGMIEGKDYHDIYQECKARANQLSNTVLIGSIA